MPTRAGIPERAIYHIPLPDPVNRLIILDQIHRSKIAGWAIDIRRLKDKDIIRNHTVLRGRAIRILRVVDPDAQTGIAAYEGVECDECPFCANIQIIGCPIHHPDTEALEPSKQVVHNDLALALKPNSSCPPLTVAEKEITLHQVAVTGTKNQEPSRLTKGVVAQDVSVRFHRNDLSLAAAPFEKIVLDDCTTRAGDGIKRILLCDQLHRLVSIVRLPGRNVDKMSSIVT